jgi:hypothetical protein
MGDGLAGEPRIRQRPILFVGTEVCLVAPDQDIDARPAGADRAYDMAQHADGGRAECGISADAAGQDRFGSQIQQLGIDKQANLHAAAIRVGCGLEAAGSPTAAAGSAAPMAPPAIPGNVNTVTGPETYPHVTQSESMV